MTALDPDLSAAPLTVKMDFRVRNLETLRKLQQKISSSDGFQMLHRVGQPSYQRPPSNVFRCFGVNKHLHLHGARPIGVWRACVGEIRRRLQRRRLALLLVFHEDFQHIGKISPRSQANFRSTKSRVGPYMIFTTGFLAGPAKVYPKPFAGVRRHRGCLSEKF